MLRADVNAAGIAGIVDVREAQGGQAAQHGKVRNTGQGQSPCRRQESEVV